VGRQREPGSRHRWARRASWGLGGFLVLVLLLVGVGLVLLTSSFGEQRVRRLVESKVSEAIAGSLDIESLSLFLTGFELRDVVLRGPEGEPVLHIERVRGDVEVLALLSQTFHVTGGLVEGLTLQLEREEGALNLARALESKQEAPKSSWTVNLDQVRVRGGELAYAGSGGDDARVDRARWADVAGELSLLSSRDATKGSLVLGGQLTAPVEGPLKLSVVGDLSDPKAEADIVVEALGATLRLGVTADTEAERYLARVEALEIPLSAGAPQALPLQASLQLQGAAWMHDGELGVGLRGALGSAELALDARGRVEEKILDGLTLQVTDLDLSEVLEQAPASDLDLHARAEGRFEDGEPLGELVAVVEPSTLAGAPVGPGKLVATIDGDGAEVGQLTLQVPGAELEASGTIAKTLSLQGGLEVTDLSKLASVVDPFTEKSLPRVGGRGRVELAISGSMETPVVEFEASFPEVMTPQGRGRGLRAEGILRPGEPLQEASLSLRVKALNLTGRKLGGIQLQAQAEDGRVEGTVRVNKPVPLRAELAGRLVEDGQRAFVLEQLRLEHPRETWRLQHPAELELGGGELLVDELALSSGKQRLVLRGGVTDGRLDAELEASLSLSPLPALLLGADGPKLGGWLTADASVGGTTQDPSVKGTARLRNGRVGELANIRADVRARWDDGRVDGSARIHAPGVRVRAEGDFPLEALREGRDAPLELSADVMVPSLRRLTRALGMDQPLRGRVNAHLRARGTTRSPQGTLVAEVSRLSRGESPPLHAQVRVAAKDEAVLAEGTLRVLEGRARFEARAELPLGAQALKAGVDWDEVPVKGQLVASGLRLEPLATLAGAFSDVDGRLDGRITVDGTLGAPNPTGRAQLRDGEVTWPGAGRFYGIRADLKATADHIRLEPLIVHSDDGKGRLSVDAKRVEDRWVLQAHLLTEDFAIVTSYKPRGELTSEGFIEGTYGNGELLLSLDIVRAHYELPEQKPPAPEGLVPADDVVVVDSRDALFREDLITQKELGAGRAPVRARNAEKEGTGGAGEDDDDDGRFRLRIDFDARQPLELVGPDIDTTLLVSEAFWLEYDDGIGMYGELGVKEGVVQVAGMNLELLTGSIVRFAGPFDVPYLDVRTRYAHPRDEVEVELRLRAEGPEPVVEAIAAPPFDEQSIFMLLASSIPGEGQPDPSGARRATTFVGEFADTFFRRLLGTRLPLEVVSVQAGPSGLSAGAVASGTWLTERVFLGYRAQPWADPERGESQSAVRLEYRLRPQVGVEVELGDADSGEANIMWNRDF
jgi:autotransporter translocation and assembly factor TamB